MMSQDSAKSYVPLPGMTSTQRKHLRGVAHSLKPVVHIGKGGVSEGLLANLDAAFESHELLKVKFSDFKDQKKEACRELNERLGSETVGIVGHVAILFRHARDPEMRRIRLVD
jgi:RNA-binding protein